MEAALTVKLMGPVGLFGCLYAFEHLRRSVLSQYPRNVIASF
jgi:hypothetical protein